MRNAPRILNVCPTEPLPGELFSDLQLEKLVSKQTLSILQNPCTEAEILRRNEIFTALSQESSVAKLEQTLSLLSDVGRNLRLLNEATLPLEKYHRKAELIRAYLAACEGLATLGDLGIPFGTVADFLSAEERKATRFAMKSSLEKVEALRKSMNGRLLSLSDKNWLTPDCEAVSEWDHIAAVAHRLGFATPQKKTQNLKPNLPLSEAICRLYENEVAEIEAELSQYYEGDFYEVTSYIPELQFLLEIQKLVQRASGLGLPSGFATVATTPTYRAKSLCDLSLLLKSATKIVPNDAHFTEQEPFSFLIGANGGGKTTYLRAVGINLVLFLGGCPVMAEKAEIFPFDTVLSHFPKDERFDRTGRLDEERKRTEQMLEKAENRHAFLLFNETFSGTDDKRGFALLTDTVTTIQNSRHFGLYVTHFHEIMSLDLPVLSAEVDTGDVNKRTFRVTKAKGSTSSYAADILKKYRLDRESLAERRANHGN